MPDTTEAAVDQGRRTWIAITCGAGAVGGVATAIPFVSTFEPSVRAKAAGAAVQVDISAIQPGEKLTLAWRGKPVWILRRTKEQIAELPKHDDELADPKSDRTAYPIPAYAMNENRSI
jgi:ubiquinol-cytochrome c reductase iron-sulfur subunit